LYVLHDFDFDGFKIFGTLNRDTRRYQFEYEIKAIDLGLRLEDIAGLEREPRAATNMSEEARREQLRKNGATEAEIAILLHERVELNAMTSDALVAMIERKLKDAGLKKVIPDDDLLAETYQAFHRSQQLREKFEELEEGFTETRIKAPKNLKKRVHAILTEHADLRWDEAIKIVLDETQLDEVSAKKDEAKKKSGDFTDGREDDQEDE
jgi:hypothetical protein